MLLGTRRIVRFAWDDDGDRTVIVRCYCGELLDAFSQSPVEPVHEWPLGA